MTQVRFFAPFALPAVTDNRRCSRLLASNFGHLRSSIPYSLLYPSLIKLPVQGPDTHSFLNHVRPSSFLKPYVQTKGRRIILCCMSFDSRNFIDPPSQAGLFGKKHLGFWLKSTIDLVDYLLGLSKLLQAFIHDFLGLVCIKIV